MHPIIFCRTDVLCKIFKHAGPAKHRDISMHKYYTCNFRGDQTTSKIENFGQKISPDIPPFTYQITPVENHRRNFFYFILRSCSNKRYYSLLWSESYPCHFSFPFTSFFIGPIGLLYSPYHQIVGQNFDVWSKFRLLSINYWPKTWFFTEISFIDQNSVYCSKLRFLVKISFLDQKLDFWSKFRFLTKNSIFVQKISFLDQKRDFSSTFRLLIKISICDQNSDSCSNFQFWVKISFVDQKLDCWPTNLVSWPKSLFVTKMSVLVQNLILQP